TSGESLASRRRLTPVRAWSAACLDPRTSGATMTATEATKSTPPSPSATASPPDGTARARGAFRILVVDDEALIRWSLHEHLVSEGYDVVEVEDGAKAIAELG